MGHKSENCVKKTKKPKYQKACTATTESVAVRVPLQNVTEVAYVTPQIQDSNEFQSVNSRSRANVRPTKPVRTPVVTSNNFQTLQDGEMNHNREAVETVVENVDEGEMPPDQHG